MGRDILFAFDTVSAICGLTEDVFIVFTATAFSLLGLRHLFFLIDGLLDRLIHLATAWPRPSPSSASSRGCTRCTRTSCRS